MAHETAGMSVMQDPSQWFCQVINGVAGSRDEVHDDFVVGFPRLNCEVLDVNVPGAGSWLASIDHLDGGSIVFV